MSMEMYTIITQYMSPESDCLSNINVYFTYLGNAVDCNQSFSSFLDEMNIHMIMFNSYQEIMASIFTNDIHAQSNTVVVKYKHICGMKYGQF